jgi:hypothetical protein
LSWRPLPAAFFVGIDPVTGLRLGTRMTSACDLSALKWNQRAGPLFSQILR